MKNLKKVLALGLALVMILGMFTIASAAETKKTAQEYPDWASVENKGAVSLMVDLGVINGMGDGTLSPANNIDRASWAKMVFFVLTGETDAKIYENDYPALKDIAKNWAQGYIEYLYSIECISGDTDGNYNPGNPISVVAAAKTMLTGLGYNSKIEGYENDSNWATNIMTRAKSVGLMDGISLKQNDNITRDAAAQMVYNALSAKTQTAKYQLNFMTGERVPSGEYTEGETLGEKAFDVKKFEAQITKVEKGVATFAAPLASIEGVKASSKDAGKTATVWCKFNSSGAATEAVSTSVDVSTAAPFKTVTGGVTWTAAMFENPTDDQKKADGYVGERAATVNFYVDGAAGVTTYTTDTVAGDVVEFYTNDDGKIDRVFVTHYNVVALGADPKSTTKDGKTTVTISSISGLTDIDSGMITGDWSSLKKDDIVLYTGNATVGFSVEKAETVNGKITNKNNKTGKITVNGTQYGGTGLTAPAALTAFAGLEPNADNVYDFYLDKNGTVIGAKLVEGEVETKVAYVLDAAWVVPTASGLSQAGDAYIEAKLLFTDATTDVVKVVKVGEDETKKIAEGNRDTTITAIKSKLADYSVDGENYTVTAKTAGEKESIDPISGVVAVKPNFNGTLTGNNSTVFLVEKTNGDDPADYYVYTGYKAVPGMTATSGTAFTKDGFVTYAFISTDAFDGDKSDALVYIPDGSDFSTGTDAKVRTYSVVDESGKVVDLQIKVDDASDVIADGFHKIATITDGVAKLSTDTVAAGEELKSIGGGVAKIGTNGSYSYDEATVCVVIDRTGDELTASTFDPESFSLEEGNTYTATFKANSDSSVLEYIYVVVTAAE